MQTESTLSTHTIFRPGNISVFDENNKLPIISWGNGACTNSPWEHVNFLSEVASHGFLVIAIGNMPKENINKNEKSISSQLIDAIDWAIAQNNNKKSPYYNKLDITKIAVSGMSCGGLQTLEAAPDPRITTVVVCNSGILSNPGDGMHGMPQLEKDQLNKFPRKGNTERWNQPEEGKVHTSTGDLHLSWDVPYEPGELVAIGKRDGKEYTYRLVTAGEPAQIRLSVDRDLIKADPTDVAHVTVEVLDKDGNFIPTADNLIKFEVEGAEIIGVESGNMSDFSSPKAKERKALNGLCLAIVQSEKPGRITVKAASEGLKGASINIVAE
ncbi:MAG: DUF4982 domain-containing protein [Prolixibacteraceae bacterium]|jgi:hypothetical protein|nr:DUF4982 domain-containing protein [Prolixibacteraceae bacterium]